MLQDPFGRRFEYLRLSITDVCNFRCVYCLPDGYQCDSSRDFLTLDEIKTTASAFAALGTKKIRITGGEPALRKDLPDIIDICAKTSGITTVALTTNGFNLKSKVGRWVDAGLDAINVSIDSLDPRQFELITGHASLHNILLGVEEAVRLGLKVKINSVLMTSDTINQLPKFADWLREFPVTLRFIELMQTGDNASFFERRHVSGKEIERKIVRDGWKETPRSMLAGPAKEYTHPDYVGKIGLIMPYSKGFCDSCNRLRISATGKLHLCLFSENGIALRDPINSGDPSAVAEKVRQALLGKDRSHYLQQGITGGTKHLAMLGG